jgi:hypothetical protein
LIIGIVLTIAFVITLQRMSTEPDDREPSRSAEAQLRVAAFNEVYAELETGRASPRAWKLESGRVVFPGIEIGECAGWTAGDTSGGIANDPPWLGGSKPPVERSFDYVRLYNDTLKNILLSRPGVCDARVVMRD